MSIVGRPASSVTPRSTTSSKTVQPASPPSLGSKPEFVNSEEKTMRSGLPSVPLRTRSIAAITSALVPLPRWINEPTTEIAPVVMSGVATV